MTDQSENLTVSSTSPEPQKNDKEYNFRALESKYRLQLEEERRAREEAEKRYEELNRQYISKANDDEDDEDDEVYTSAKKFKKFKQEQQKLNYALKKETEKEVEKRVKEALEQNEVKKWFDQHSDYGNVVNEENCYALYNDHPELATVIEKLPNGFEKQQLAYQTIKKLGIGQPKKSNIQEQIDNNRRGPYYQPSGTGMPAYSSQTDFSPAGQKQAYEKMLELKKRMRI